MRRSLETSEWLYFLLIKCGCPYIFLHVTCPDGPVITKGHKRVLLEQCRADIWLRNRVLLNAKDQTRTKLSMWHQLAIMSPNGVFYVWKPEYWHFMFKTGTIVATYILEWPGQMATCTTLVTDKIFIADMEGMEPDVYVVGLLLPIGFISWFDVTLWHGSY